MPMPRKTPPAYCAIVLMLTDPESLEQLEESLRLYPDELLAAQVRYPADYLAKWDAETRARRLTGVAANDCHHNQILLMKMVDDATVVVRHQRRPRRPDAKVHGGPQAGHSRLDQGASAG